MASSTVCDKCDGTGWIVVERGTVSDAQPSTCRADDKKIRRVERAKIPPIYEKASLENFKLPGDNSIARMDLSKACTTVGAYVREFPWGPKPGLLFIGDQGCGK